MELKQLEYIVAIAETGSITRAAEQLYMTQPSLSLALSRLEKSLGMKLFTREKNQLILTNAGQLYVATAKEMLEMRDRLYKQMKELAQSSKTLRVGISSLTCSQMFGIVYSQFKERYPNINIELHEANAHPLEQMLLDDTISLACTVFNKECHTQKRLTYTTLRKESFRLGISRNHPAVKELHLSEDHAVCLSAFKEIPFIQSPPNTYRREIEEQSFHKCGLKPLVSCTVNNPFTIKRMVAEGKGFAFFSDGFRDVQDPILYLKIDSDPYWCIGILCSDNHVMNKQENYFIQLIRELILSILVDTFFSRDITDYAASFKVS